MIKELNFEEKKCAEWFIKNHADNVYIMDIRDNPQNPEHIHITIDITERSPNILVGVSGSIRRTIL
jgi:hypothetical protein